MNNMKKTTAINIIKRLRKEKKELEKEFEVLEKKNESEEIFIYRWIIWNITIQVWPSVSADKIKECDLFTSILTENKRLIKETEKLRNRKWYNFFNN